MCEPYFQKIPLNTALQLIVSSFESSAKDLNLKYKKTYPLLQIFKMLILQLTSNTSMSIPDICHFFTPMPILGLEKVCQKSACIHNIASRQNSLKQYYGVKFTYSFQQVIRRRNWCFDWHIIMINMAYLVVWLAYSFD